MPFFTAASKADFQHQLQQALSHHVDEQTLPRLAVFAEQFFGIVALEELTQRRLTDLVGCVLSAWRLLERFDPAQPQVNVFNPDYERHGWQSTHTAVEVLHADVPFLVDSVRMQINRSGYSVHTLQNSVLSVRRDSAGRLLEVLPKGAQGEGVSQEALVFLEIDRCASASDMKALEATLQDVLGEVRLAVGDFGAMRQKLFELINALETSPASPEERAEVKTFLQWLHDDHFTFLGYEELTVHEDGDGGRIFYDEASLLGLSKHLRKGLTAETAHISAESLRYFREPVLLSFAKAALPSRVHRPAYPDFVSIRETDEQGNVVREHRFMGLYTSSVYNQSVRTIPYIRCKVEEVRRRADFGASAHLGKELAQVLEALPRDDLFQTPPDDLFATAMAIVQIQERNKVRVFLRKDPYGRFYYCLAYVPRDIYSTEVRQKMQQILMDRLHGTDCEFWTFFSESVLARVQFILRVDPERPLDIDPSRIEQEMIQACRSWKDDYANLVIDNLGEAQGTSVLADFPHGFPAGYRERFAPHLAVVDIRHLLNLSESRPLIMSFYQPLGQTADNNVLHCKLYHADTPLALSDVLPILENLGLRVLGEFPYNLRRKNGQEYWIHDFAFTTVAGLDVDLQQLNDTFQDAFIHIVNGSAENDSFNRLVLTAGLAWRDVALLRAYARYLKQIRIGFDVGYIASTLNNHVDIARELTRLFRMRFYLARRMSPEDLEDKQQRLEQAILAALDNVAVLNEDRILRRYLDLIKATLRTNFYQPDANGQPKSYFSFKFNPRAIPELPKPIPKYEIFVYSPRVEGVHLRGGKVARGGLRWSDREEDYRTEVLGLVKAQQVKNSVIVPVGAKGGFVPRRLPVGGSRDEIQAEAIACYRIFISGLLDITDNLKEGVVVPPANVVRQDDDDPYLVVAADKGTATFSDIANGIAADYGFWLGDAFASGGSAGYDHKKMGITSRGAWVSVQRHFRERGIDVQRDPVTVLGIGDMAGDVFGNGLLRSESLQLVAAFNHLHIFIDPNPDAARSFAERKRLFDLPRSSWTDYDKSLISEGGGIFSRSAKRIDITPQMKERFAIKADQLTPTELIHALLKAPVDLIWNGGIGTYVKASFESHADIGDKANDGLRVDGRELRAKVIGEGGNLGMSQLARVEFGLNGGACNTDFIDNAGGVDCSDHEVNIKILLGEVVASGDMTLKQRNQLMVEMTDEVGELVVGNNYKQTQALSLAERRARSHLAEYKRVIVDLESRGKLDRALEFLPSDEVLAERASQGIGLTRAELSVLISYAKIDLKEQLLKSSVPDDEYLSRDMHSAFPQRLTEEFGEAMQRHRLKREIVSTQIANDLINNMGITFIQRLRESTAMSAADIARAYVVMRDVLHLPHWWRQIEALDYKVPADLQMTLMDELMRLGRRATRWFLRSRRGELDAARDVAHFGPRIAALGVRLNELLEGGPREQWEARYQQYIEQGTPELLARVVAGTTHIYTLLPIIQAADVTGHDPIEVASTWFAVGSALDLTWYQQQLNELPVANAWQALAREAFRDELDAQQRIMTIAVLQMPDAPEEIAARVALWLEHNRSMVERWRAMLGDVRAATGNDVAMYAVATRELMDLATLGSAASSTM